MKNPFSAIFRRNITRKLLVINLLICITFCLITVVVLSSFYQIQDILETVFAAEIKRVAANGSLGRDLADVIGEANLVVTAFYGNEDLLDNRGEPLLQKATALQTRTEDERLVEALTGFTRTIESVIDQCRMVNQVRALFGKAFKRLCCAQRNPTGECALLCQRDADRDGREFRSQWRKDSCASKC